MKKTLGSFIRDRRIELGLTQEALAERVGDTVRQAEISRLEHDKVTLPRRDRLEGIAAALDISIGDLLVATGWLTDEHLAVLPGGFSENGHAEGKPATAGSDEPLTHAEESLAEAKEMVAQTAEKLEEAEQALVLARQDEHGETHAAKTSSIPAI
jgi:transcriptional regulator with XRE-family HTH domain